MTVVITGIMASGKSTVAQALAERLPRAAHVRGDVFRRMIVSGGEGMSPSPSPEALRQLRLRYRLAASTADTYAEAGFIPVVQDVIIGEELATLLGYFRIRPVRLFVLDPHPHAVEERERRRAKTGYHGFTVAQLHEVLHDQTPRLGLWLDTTRQSVAETVDEILARWNEAIVDP
ncbi:AAA family ATPase [Nonomuraea sp. NPDC050663]|uniref:AAA family ATPase n=1 Tax=Nonomuraea sp. NPDC050663 TaxID=3364370 RepID=UPI0037A89E52